MPDRSFRPNEISSGGVVVRSHNGSYQVCLVNDGSRWGLPKGIIEPGESARDAALREISEETGLDRNSLSVGAELPVSEYVYRRRDDGRLIFKRVHHFLVVAPSDAALHPDPAEIAEARWLDFDSAIATASFRDTRIAIEAARGVLDSAT